MTRTPLPQRRHQTTETIQFHGAVYHISIGTYPDGRPGEVFCTGPKAGSAMAAVVADAAVLMSLLLQMGAAPTLLCKSLGREGKDNAPASIVGLIADLVDKGIGVE